MLPPSVHDKLLDVCEDIGEGLYRTEDESASWFFNYIGLDSRRIPLETISELDAFPFRFNVFGYHLLFISLASVDEVGGVEGKSQVDTRDYQVELTSAAKRLEAKGYSYPVCAYLLITKITEKAIAQLGPQKAYELNEIVRKFSLKDMTRHRNWKPEVGTAIRQKYLDYVVDDADTIFAHKEYYRVGILDDEFIAICIENGIDPQVASDLAT